jgi:hypothetical protein
MRDVFATELADRSPAARRALAARFLNEAGKAVNQPVDQYVLLGGAYQAAKEGADLDLCLQAVNAITTAFEVDGVAMKLAALPAVSSGSDPAKARGVVTAGLALLDDAVAEDNYDAARAAASQVEQAAARAGDPSLLGYARERAKEARFVAGEYARIQKDLAVLLARPDDLKSNESVGRFLCFVKGDWKNGLPFLALGGDAALRSAAAAELAAAAAHGADRLKVAEEWWAIAQHTTGPARAAIERHAAAHYQAAAEILTGLEKLGIQKRLAEVLPLSFSVGDEYKWTRGDPPMEMIPVSRGICIFTGIGGGFHGGGEEVGMGVGDGAAWRLAGRAASDPVAIVTALLTPGAGVFKAPAEYQWKSGGAPVRMIRTDEGVCLLSGISGGLRGGGEDVRVYPGEDGYWYLGGHAAAPFTAHALAIRPVKAGIYRAVYDEALWTANTGAVRLIAKNEGFCFISGVGGKYEGTGERVNLSVGDDGFWYLDGKSAQASLTARAISVRIIQGRP